MTARTRWTQYSVDAQGEATDGNGNGGVGTLAYSRATANVGDTFTIGPTTNRLYITLDGETAPYITMYSGSGLDPRFLAKDITEKMHALGKNSDRWNAAKCVWTNSKSEGNCFELYSGTIGTSASVVVAPTEINSGASILGFGTATEQGGLATSNGFGGDLTVSGTYYGLTDELYTIVISNDVYAEATSAPRGIATPAKDVSNSYDGSFITGGVFSGGSDIIYTISIDVTNGTTMGGGTGNVPMLAWTSNGGDSSTTYTELLFPKTWYKVGDYGFMVKFTDAVFNQASPAWTVLCKKPDYVGGSNASGPVATAEYVWSSDRGDMSSTPVTTVADTFTQLGTRGLSIKFNPPGGADNFSAGDVFHVLCKAPQPLNYNITSLNYGNVTVSTESDVKCVVFEVEAGAAEVSTVKFGLQSHGTFSHHKTGNLDTQFRFGTAGPKNLAGTSPNTGIEWYPGVAAGDIDSDTPPTYLFDTKANLSVVSTADDSQIIGNLGIMSDPMWVNIRLGSSETGANSTINMRLYFDYS